MDMPCPQLSAHQNKLQQQRSGRKRETNKTHQSQNDGLQMGQEKKPVKKEIMPITMPMTHLAYKSGQRQCSDDQYPDQLPRLEGMGDVLSRLREVLSDSIKDLQTRSYEVMFKVADMEETIVAQGKIIESVEENAYRVNEISLREHEASIKTDFNNHFQVLAHSHDSLWKNLERLKYEYRLEIGACSLKVQQEVSVRVQARVTEALNDWLHQRGSSLEIDIVSIQSEIDGIKRRQLEMLTRPDIHDVLQPFEDRLAQTIKRLNTKHCSLYCSVRYRELKQFVEVHVQRELQRVGIDQLLDQVSGNREIQTNENEPCEEETQGTVTFNHLQEQIDATNQTIMLLRNQIDSLKLQTWISLGLSFVICTLCLSV